jgi:uncharacterized membrane protein YfcA
MLSEFLPQLPLLMVVILTALACLPGAVIGMVAGHAIFRRFPPRVLEIVVAAFLLAIGLKLLIWP